MKTKIKIKNEFQNPDLIFGNEIQKRNSKLYWQMKIKIVKWNQKMKIENQIWKGELNYVYMECWRIKIEKRKL